jgi:hypothetical protein
MPALTTVPVLILAGGDTPAATGTIALTNTDATA